MSCDLQIENKMFSDKLHSEFKQIFFDNQRLEREKI